MSGMRLPKPIALALLAGSVVLASLPALAQGTAAPSGFIKLPPAVIAEFKGGASKFMDNYKSGGLPLTNQVKNLVLSDSTTLADILTAAKSTTSVQNAAIGAGLAEAARAIAPTNPQLATEIQTQVVASGLADLLAAYTAVSNSTVTAATGGGGGGGGGGAGGGVGGPVGGVLNSDGGNNGSTTAASSSSATNSAFSSGISPGGSPPSGGSTTATTTSVSPTSL